jgi:hypothetical protein
MSELQDVPSDQKPRTERIIVFEDSVIEQDVFTKVEEELIDHLGKNHSEWVGGFAWHEEWRATSTGRIASNDVVDAQTRFERALDFCSKSSFKGVCIFDLNMPAVKTGSIVGLDTILEGCPNNLRASAEKYPGILLALAAARNPNADILICIATSSGETVDDFEDAFNKTTGKKFKTFNNGGLPDQSKDQLVKVLSKQIDNYIENRSPDEIQNLFWPHYTANWFKASTSNQSELTAEVPHNRPADEKHDAFKKLSGYAKGVAAFGKMISGTDNKELSNEEIADLDIWVLSDGVYEVLKSFVGHCSPCNGGSYPLKLPVLAFSLLAAVGPGSWLKSVPWAELSSFECPVLGKRKDDCRQAVLAAYHFFRTLQVHRDSGERNTVSVRFSKGEVTGDKMSLAYLDFSFGFSCVEKGGLFLQRLCGGSAEPERMDLANDSPSAFKDLKMSLRNPRLAPQTHVWVFPETVDDIQRTVIRFGVYDVERFKNQ